MIVAVLVPSVAATDVLMVVQLVSERFVETSRPAEVAAVDHEMETVSAVEEIFNLPMGRTDIDTGRIAQLQARHSTASCSL